MDPSDKDSNFLARKQDFAYFIAPDNGANLYRDKTEDMVNNGKKRLIVNLRDINEYDPALRTNILQSPMDYIPSWEESLNDYIKHSSFTDKTNLKPGEEYKIGVEGSFGGNRLTPQKLMARSIGTMVAVEGIVTKVSLVRPKVKETVHYCQATKQFVTQKYRDSTSLLGAPTSNTYPTTDANGNNLTTEFGLSTFSDHQKVYIQDMPERTEPGSMPQTIECILDDDLVDACKPGDRVQMVGIYRALSNKRATGSTSGRFNTVILVNNVIKIGIGSSKKISDGSTVLSAKEIRNIKKMSKRKDIFNLLSLSMIPSIHGHSFIKKAILLQLLGGITKNLDNGTHLRGDINILMVGDPSCGKSQLLRGVMNLGRLVINTTGRGSSGVGLTAAVTTDKDSGDKKLEAGAMVLADGGIVCIDEFDKMTDVDRTAIHEVMEQQTVTIAKAGIHTSLNARCSVIAAANPVYGMYDRYKKPHENIGLPDSLLSRFDLLFIVLDKIDTKIDKAISDHVLKMHLTPYNIISNNNDMDDDDDDDQNKDGDAPIWSKQRLNKRTKIFTIEFLKKYIDFAKKQYKPLLTDEACEEIANKYANLREEERNQTLPITARCLETIIRLSTAHAKLRLSKKIGVVDVDAAMEVLSFALTNDADPQKKSKKKRKPVDGDDIDLDEDDDDDDDVMDDIKRKRGKQPMDDDDDDDVEMDMADQDDAKMGELDDNNNNNKTKRGRRKRKKPDMDDDVDDDDNDDQMVSQSKRVRRNIPSNINQSNVKKVTKFLSDHFRINRTGQINKSELFKKLNDNDNVDMTQNELDNIIQHLHTENKIFYMAPMIHQL